MQQSVLLYIQHKELQHATISQQTKCNRLQMANNTECILVLHFASKRAYNVCSELQHATKGGIKS